MYKAAKKYEIPYNTLKAALKNEPSKVDPNSLAKLGKPFSLTIEEEKNLVKHIAKIQELDFDLSATDVRKYAFKIAKESGRKHAFSKKEPLAGWKWWTNFKERYKITMRPPGSLFRYRGAEIIKKPIAQFFTDLETVFDKYELHQKPHLIWNLDEARFSYENDLEEIVTLKGNRRISEEPSDRGDTVSVALTINAAGQCGPCLVIFNGKKAVTNEIEAEAPPNSMVTVSKNGCIDIEIFLSFLNHFVEFLSPERPILLLINPDSSYVALEVLQFAHDNQIIFITFPSHATFRLQPLDLSVFGPMKTRWKEKLKGILKETRHTIYRPIRNDILTSFRDAFETSSTLQNICNGFRESGIYPLNKGAILEELLNVSTVVATSTSAVSWSEKIASLPVPMEHEILSAPIQEIRKRKGTAPDTKPTKESTSLKVSIPTASSTSDSPKKKGKKLSSRYVTT